MKQKLFTLLLALVTSIGMVHAEIYSGACGDNLTWSLNTEDSTLTISGNGAMTDYTLWTLVQTSWGSQKDFIKSISLPNGLTNIGDYAFYGLNKLTTINIPNGVTRIGEEAFHSCVNIRSISIPSSITNIGQNAFSRCDSLSSVYIDDLASWCSISFANMYSNPLSLAEHLFLNASEVVNLNIPNSVTSIGDYAFCRCTNITSITIPNSVTSIGRSAFYNCIGLTSVTIPNSVLSIGDDAFYSCKGLTSVTIPNSVTSIGNNAFYQCFFLTSVTIPSSVTSIGTNAFLRIPNISYQGSAEGAPWGAKCVNGFIDNDFVYADETKTILKACFLRKNGNTVIPIGVTEIGAFAFYQCSSITNITIPNSVTSIEEYAFYQCTGITSINIPNSVKNIGKNAFAHCSGITNVNMSNSVTNIAEYAFAYCSSLTSVTLSNSITSLENRIFYKCSSLTNIVIPHSVTSIGEYALGDCPILTSVTMSNNVTIIKRSAFTRCYNLMSIDFPNILTSIGADAFYNCTGLTSINIPSSITSIGGSAFRECTNLTSVHISDLAAWCRISFKSEGSNPLSSAKHLFLNGAEITYLNIPDSVTSIGNYAFTNCIGITSVNIPSSITSIGGSAFRECTNLATVNNYSPLQLEAGVQDANNSYCSYYATTVNNYYTINGTCGSSLIWELTGGKLTISGNGAMDNFSYTNIPWYAYRNRIDTIEILNGVTSIGNNAFYSCANLMNVTIPNSVTSIGESAFYGCNNLMNVTIPNSVISIGNYAFSEVFNVNYSSSITGAPWGAQCLNKYVEGCLAFNDATKTILHACAQGKIGDVVVPNGVTSIEDLAFLFCDKVTSVTFSNSITNIGNSVFSAAANLTTVTFGEGVKTIGFSIFEDCPKLTSIVWNAKRCSDFESTSTYTSTLFYYHSSTNPSLDYDIRSQITSFIFGNQVEYIPAYLCSNLTNVQEIVVPSCRVEIGTNAFLNCNYRIGGIYSITLPDTTLCYDDDLIIGGVNYPYTKTIGSQRTWTQTLQSANGCDSTVTISVNWTKIPKVVYFSVKEEYDSPNTGSIAISQIEQGSYDYYTLNGKRNASLKNLSSGNYTIVFYNEICGDSLIEEVSIDQYGMKVGKIYYLLNKDNHTATVTYRGTYEYEYNNEYSGDITIPNTITYNREEYQVTAIGPYAFYGCSTLRSVTMESEAPISMRNCGLSQSCVIYVPYGSLTAYKTNSYWNQYNLHVVNPRHSNYTSGATSVNITLGNSNDAQHIVSCGLYGGEEFAGNMAEYIGLDPNSQYDDVPFFVRTKEGDYDTLHCSFTTTALELTTQPSKAVSSNTAILLAQTNMADIETSCGFEYKRNDAPADMAGTKVFCPVANGTMAGRLKGLKDDVYYKYRAFYQSAAGNMYYGEWQYIFTGDIAVEFDPILYTYAATAVNENAATIKGYALAGSDDFTEQGFEYWADSRNGSANAPYRIPAAFGEHQTVTASGISMRVTLTDLDAGTVYKYRTYAKVGGQILYGSEMSFTTQGTYTPPTYIITFVNWDGTELQSEPVEEGVMPVYNGETPVRPEDEQYTYTFTGWTPEVVAAAADATYTATYNVTQKSEGLEDVKSDNTASKILRNGQIFILRGDKTYTVTGHELK